MKLFGHSINRASTNAWKKRWVHVLAVPIKTIVFYWVVQLIHLLKKIARLRTWSRLVLVASVYTIVQIHNMLIKDILIYKYTTYTWDWSFVFLLFFICFGLCSFSWLLYWRACLVIFVVSFSLLDQSSWSNFKFNNFYVTLMISCNDICRLLYKITISIKKKRRSKIFSDKEGT